MKVTIQQKIAMAALGSATVLFLACGSGTITDPDSNDEAAIASAMLPTDKAIIDSMIAVCASGTINCDEGGDTKVPSSSSTDASSSAVAASSSGAAVASSSSAAVVASSSGAAPTVSSSSAKASSSSAAVVSSSSNAPSSSSAAVSSSSQVLPSGTIMMPTGDSVTVGNTYKLEGQCNGSTLQIWGAPDVDVVVNGTAVTGKDYKATTVTLPATLVVNKGTKISCY